MPNPYGITQVDVGGALGTISNLENNALQRKGLQSQITARDTATKRASALSAAVPNALQGDQSALDTVAGLDPELFMKMDDRQREQMNEHLERTASILFAAKKDPSRYPQLRQMAIEQMGLDPADIPEQYDEAYIDAQANQVLGIAEMMKIAEGDDPSSIREWDRYNSLSEKDQKRFLEMKRAQQFKINDVGGVPTATTLEAGEINTQPLSTLGQEIGAASAQAVGVQQAKDQLGFQQALPSDIAELKKFRENIQGLLNDDGFDIIYGLSGKTDPRAHMPGGAAASAKARLGQLDAATFALTIQKMRGLGSLSDAEGKKISAAFTRATNPNLGEKDARDAWDEVIEGTDLAEARLVARAGGDQQQSQVPRTSPTAAPNVIRYDAQGNRVQ